MHVPQIAFTGAFRVHGGRRKPTNEFRAFIAASRQGGRTRRRIWRLVLRFHVQLVGIILGLIGWINRLPQRADKLVRDHAPIHARKFSERALKPMATFRECAKECPEMIVINGFRVGVAQRPSCGC
jgi:hypothetical protein